LDRDGYLDAVNAQAAEFNPRQFSGGIREFGTLKKAKQEQENSREWRMEKERRWTRSFRAWRLLYLTGRQGRASSSNAPTAEGQLLGGPADRAYLWDWRRLMLGAKGRVH